VVVVDEVSQLTQINPETGPMLTQLSQMAGGLNLNLLIASQAANPSVFGDKGSLAKANFPSRLVFQLPREQAYLATGLEGQHTEKLGGDGDGLAIVNGRTTRFRAAWPEERDYEALPRLAQEPTPPDQDELAGDRLVDDWQIDPDRLAYALVVKSSATALRSQFGGGTAKSMLVRDYSQLLKQRIRYWRRFREAA
jgi:DNA segregation ATPase FtsK/SpoIIIE-like protein